MKLSASPVLEEYGYLVHARSDSSWPTPALVEGSSWWVADGRWDDTHGTRGSTEEQKGGKSGGGRSTPAVLRPGLLLGVGFVPQDCVDFLDDLRGQLSEDLSEEKEGGEVSMKKLVHPPPICHICIVAAATSRLFFKVSWVQNDKHS